MECRNGFLYTPPNGQTVQKRDKSTGAKTRDVNGNISKSVCTTTLRSWAEKPGTTKERMSERAVRRDGCLEYQ
jgi:hypothetical protein